MVKLKKILLAVLLLAALVTTSHYWIPETLIAPEHDPGLSSPEEVVELTVLGVPESLLAAWSEQLGGADLDIFNNLVGEHTLRLALPETADSLALWEVRRFQFSPTGKAVSFELGETSGSNADLAALYRSCRKDGRYRWLAVDYAARLANGAKTGFAAQNPSLKAGSAAVIKYEIILLQQAPPANPRVGLYTGEGAWEVNIQAIQNFLDHYGIGWETFTEADIADTDLNECYDLLWFPGGFSAEYRHYIPDHDKIRSFVASGGAFVGSCAGAYYAADFILFNGKTSEYPLKLFSGQAVGPLSKYYRWGEKATLTLENGHNFNLAFDPDLDMYYFDGPSFYPHEQEAVAVLARYGKDQSPAVISFNYGAGKVLLLGPHPELGYIPSAGSVNTHGGDGAQWPWLYELLQWLLTQQ